MPTDDTDDPTEGHPPVDWELLGRYLAGECSAAEVDEIGRWADQGPACATLLADARRWWDQAGALPSPTRIEANWVELRRRMQSDDDIPARAPGGSRVAIAFGGQERVGLRQRWVRLAIPALAAGIAFLAIGFAVRSRPEPVAPAPPPAVGREYRTARGQRATLTLPDGSQVELGVDSRIVVSISDSGRREIRLEGEAVFDVLHDPERPFAVYAGDAVMEDLGTRFGIRAYPEDRQVRIVVVEGEVALRPAVARSAADTTATVLGARDFAVLDARGRLQLRHGVDAALYLGWTERRLVFQQATLAETAAQLERWYDVDISIRDPGAAARRVTVDLKAASLPEVLDAVTVPLGLRYERVGRRVVVHR